TATSAQDDLASALKAAQSWITAANNSEAAANVYALAQEILSDAKQAKQDIDDAQSAAVKPALWAKGAVTADMASAPGATTPGDAVADLTSAQTSVEDAIAKARSAISSMQQAGYSEASIASANFDLDSASAVQSALASALKAANDQTATEASYTKAEALVQSLGQKVSQTTSQLQNFEPIGEELNLDSKILSEAFAFSAASSPVSHSAVPTSYAPSAGGTKLPSAEVPSTSTASNSTASGMQSSSSETSSASSSSDQLAVTGSSAEDMEIASAVLMAGGIAVEAVKKSRGRHARNR
ncbi:MAG: hypothetical protein IIY98_02390, partial [Aeriscardovia sp.]|nr:hypothetical protein [Aeriscardovia sp.]